MGRGKGCRAAAAAVACCTYVLPSWRLKRFFDTKSKMPRTCQTQHKDCSGSPAPLRSLSPPFAHSLCSLVCQVAPCLCLCSQYPVLAFGKVIYAMSMHSMSSVKSKREPYSTPLSITNPFPTLIEIFANANIFQVVHKYLCNLLRIQLMLIFAQCTRIFFGIRNAQKTPAAAPLIN